MTPRVRHQGRLSTECRGLRSRQPSQVSPSIENCPLGGRGGFVSGAITANSRSTTATGRLLGTSGTLLGAFSFQRLRPAALTRPIRSTQRGRISPARPDRPCGAASRQSSRRHSGSCQRARSSAENLARAAGAPLLRRMPATVAAQVYLILGPLAPPDGREKRPGVRGPRVPDGAPAPPPWRDRPSGHGSRRTAWRALRGSPNGDY